MRVAVGMAALAFASSIAIANAAPVDLLPPGFGDPTPAPSPTPTPAPAQPAVPTPAPSGREVVQPVPSGSSSSGSSSSDAPSNLPTQRELEALSTDELDELLGLRPRVDIPAAVARSTDVVGVIGPDQGGVGEAVFVNQPAALVRAALVGNEGRYVSRWGHILLRRALASRLRAPEGFNPVAFATQRAALLNRMGEYSAARALIQSVDTANYSPAMTQAAIEAYLGTGDVVGACPTVRLSREERDDGEWRMLRAICNAYAGETSRASTDLRRIQASGEFPRIDVLLAQRYAGAAGDGRRAVTIEWDGIDTLSRWRFALANALGEPIPDELLESAPSDLTEQLAFAPAVAPPNRIAPASNAARRGILSGQALIDLYSQIAAIEEFDGPGSETATRLRDAFAASTGTARVAALSELWQEDGVAGHIMTAQAAARIPVSNRYVDSAEDLIRAMMTGGFARNAGLWNEVVDGGSPAWGILAVGDPDAGVASDGNLSSFLDDDTSAGQLRSRLLFAGLAGLDRLAADERSEYAGRLNVDLSRSSRWTRAIQGATETGNAGMAVLLAGLGMQGDEWSDMTPLHLYHIVRALAASGLEAEARMIAAEAVASV